MRANLLSCLITTQLAALTAALAIEGRVIDKPEGRALANVEVIVVGHTQNVRSDAEGRFVLVPDPRPPFELLLVLPGERYVGPILFESLPPEGPLVVEIAPFASEFVTVTAGAAPDIQTAPASGMTLVSRDDIRSREARTLAEALENVPGVSSVSEGHAAVPAIRGLAQGRSVLLVDGARVTSERRIGPSATFLDPFVLDGVEIARGPGSVAYGSDAFGGVILAKTRTPQPGGPLALTLSGSLGAGIPQGRLGFEIESGLSQRSGVLFSVHHREFSDYQSPDGEVLNSGSRDQGFLARYVHVRDRGIFSVGLQGDYGRDIERPRTNSQTVRFYYPREDSLRLTASYATGPVARFDSTELALFFGHQRIVTDQDQYATSTDPRQIKRADLSVEDFELRALAAKAWGQVRFDFGVDLNGRLGLAAEDIVIDFENAGRPAGYDAQFSIESAQRIDSALFVAAEGAIRSGITVAGGLRIDRVKSSNDGGFFGDVTIGGSEPSGFASLTFGAYSGFSTTVQFARGFRDARLSDRFFRGVTGSGFITGNPSLDSETSEQYDLALRYTRGRWRSAFYAYNYRIEQLIERYAEPAESELFVFRNRGRARISGVEIETQAELTGRWILELAASAAAGESLDDGDPLDDIQPLSLSVQARKAIGERTYVKLRGAFFGELDEPGPNEIRVASHTVADVAAGFQATPACELQLLVRNLFDAAYAASTDRRSPLAPGISGVLTARFEF